MPLTWEMLDEIPAALMAALSSMNLLQVVSTSPGKFINNIRQHSTRWSERALSPQRA
jgi:hypothetical protein